MLAWRLCPSVPICCFAASEVSFFSAPPIPTIVRAFLPYCAQVKADIVIRMTGLPLPTRSSQSGRQRFKGGYQSTAVIPRDHPLAVCRPKLPFDVRPRNDCDEFVTGHWAEKPAKRPLLDLLADRNATITFVRIRVHVAANIGKTTDVDRRCRACLALVEKRPSTALDRIWLCYCPAVRRRSVACFTERHYPMTAIRWLMMTLRRRSCRRS